MSTRAHQGRVNRARELGTYEDMRETLEHLVLIEGRSFHTVSGIIGRSYAWTAYVCEVLGIKSVSKGQSPTEQTIVEMREALAAQRTVELALVAAVRRAYGPVGRGW